MGANEDAAGGLLLLIGLILFGLYMLVMFIIEYIVFFFFLGLIIWAIYYYVQNAPEWERQAKKKTQFAINNRKNHDNFKTWYSIGKENIETLQSSFLDRQYHTDFMKMESELKSYNRFLVAPESLYKQSMTLTFNPYLDPYQKVSNLIDKTIHLPVSLEKFREQYKSLLDKRVDSAMIDNISETLSDSNILRNGHPRGAIILEKQFELENSRLHYISVAAFEPNNIQSSPRVATDTPHLDTIKNS